MASQPSLVYDMIMRRDYQTRPGRLSTRHAAASSEGTREKKTRTKPTPPVTCLPAIECSGEYSLTFRRLYCLHLSHFHTQMDERRLELPFLPDHSYLSPAYPTIAAKSLQRRAQSRGGTAHVILKVVTITASFSALSTWSLYTAAIMLFATTCHFVSRHAGIAWA